MEGEPLDGLHLHNTQDQKKRLRPGQTSAGPEDGRQRQHHQPCTDGRLAARQEQQGRAADGGHARGISQQEAAQRGEDILREQEERQGQPGPEPRPPRALPQPRRSRRAGVHLIESMVSSSLQIFSISARVYILPLPTPGQFSDILSQRFLLDML